MRMDKETVREIPDGLSLVGAYKEGSELAVKDGALHRKLGEGVYDHREDAGPKQPVWN